MPCSQNGSINVIFSQILEFDVCAAEPLFHSPDGRIVFQRIILRGTNAPTVCCQLDLGFIRRIITSPVAYRVTQGSTRSSRQNHLQTMVCTAHPHEMNIVIRSLYYTIRQLHPSSALINLSVSFIVALFSPALPPPCLESHRVLAPF